MFVWSHLGNTGKKGVVDKLEDNDRTVSAVKGRRLGHVETVGKINLVVELVANRRE